MNKRVLIIGYPYPDANMGGVRLRRIARLLPRYGWDPVVMTHPFPSHGNESPPNVRVEQVAALDLTHWYRRIGSRNQDARPSSPARPQPKAQNIALTSKFNRWLMIPDKQIPWRRPAIKHGRALLRRENFSAIFASLDPRTSFLVGAQLARETGVPCVLEYRDLWVGNPYYHITQPTPLHRWLHQRLERNALRQASRVSAVCRGIAHYLDDAHGSVLRAPVEVNYNFFDPEEYRDLRPEASGRKPFTVSYTGAMYGARSPHQFFQGMRLFIDEKKLNAEQFRFQWAGGSAGINDLDEVINRTGIRPYMDFLGMIPHREALRLMKESDVALLLQAPGDAIHIPGKLFEAMGARKPLLAVAHPCETADIIGRCGAGLVCDHAKESVATALAKFHHLSFTRDSWNFNEDEVNKFSADSAVRKLANLFDQVSR